MKIPATSILLSTFALVIFTPQTTALPLPKLNSSFDVSHASHQLKATSSTTINSISALSKMKFPSHSASPSPTSFDHSLDLRSVSATEAVKHLPKRQEPHPVSGYWLGLLVLFSALMFITFVLLEITRFCNNERSMFWYWKMELMMMGWKPEEKMKAYEEKEKQKQKQRK